MADSEKMIAVKTEIKEELENMDEQEIEMEDSYWKKCTMDIDPLCGTECSPCTAVKTELDNENRDNREQSELIATVTGKMKSDVSECGTSTPNMNLNNIGNRSDNVLKTEDLTTPIIKTETDQSDEMSANTDYLSYINTTHFMMTEELDIKSKHEYEQDESVVEVEDNLDTDSKSSVASPRETPQENNEAQNSGIILRKLLSNHENNKDQNLTDKTIYTNEKPHKCDLCTKSFNYASDLNRHKLCHTGEKPYKCDLCEKSFTGRSGLTMHRRNHTGEKPYNCDQCNKSFSQKIQLTVHYRVHTGEKPYRCEHCHKSFTVSSQLITHKRSHTGEKPYKCDLCHKSFTINNHLMRHKRLHTGERPYKCELCDKSFNDKGGLVRHSYSHTGEKPYKCELCDRSFTAIWDLTMHKRRHGGVTS